MNAAFITAIPLSLRRPCALASSSNSSNNNNTSDVQCTSFTTRFLIRAARPSRLSQRTMTMQQERGELVASSQDEKKEPSTLSSFFSTARKMLAVAALAFVLAFPMDSLAARGGARMGGSQFRAPPQQQRSAPSPRSYGSPSYYGPSVPSYGYGGYGYGYGPSIFLNPFVAPIGPVGFGLGGFGGLLAFATVMSLVTSAVRSRSATAAEGEGGITSADPTTTVALIKVGLLSSARSLQVDLDTLARTADTTTPSGLTFLLQETATALLRHPDYWAYSSSTARTKSLSKAESEFNRIALQERLKLKEETLTNTGGRRYEAPRASAKDTDLEKAPSEYIVVSLVVAGSGDLVKQLPRRIDSVSDVDRALRAVASVSADSLQAVEIVWAPQSLRDTLSEQEMLSDHPELKRL